MARTSTSRAGCLEFEGRAIHYRTGGDGIIADRPSLVFLHGAGGNARIWMRLLLHFQKRFNTVLVDLPGHGRSPATSGCVDTLHSYAGGIRALIERTLPGPFAMIGHSLGGAITLHMALDAPGGLSGIVPVCTAAMHPMAGTIAGWIRDDHAEAVRKICRDLLYRRGARTDLVKLSIADLGRVAEDVLLNDMVIASSCDMTADLSAIEVPVLIVAGGQDRLCPPEYSFSMAERIPGARLEIIEDSGHMAMIERPRKLIGALEPFFHGLFEVTRPGGPSRPGGKDA